MNSKENLGENSMEEHSDSINLRKATTIPNAASAGRMALAYAPNIIDRSSSPVTSLLHDFASQVQVSVSAPPSARRSLNEPLALSDSYELERPFELNHQLTFRFDAAPESNPRRVSALQNLKSRSCGDVGALLEQETQLFRSPFNRSEPSNGCLSGSAPLSRSGSAGLLLPPTNQLAVSGTLPVDFQLALPTIKGSSSHYNSISPDTLRRLIDGFYGDIAQFIVVDCRYDYEYNGGHIRNAINISKPELVVSKFLSEHSTLHLRQRTVIVFHCEFSQKRGPAAYQALRSADRKQNEKHYPELCYPDIYLLDGGYKAFYDSFKEYCDPCSYLPMKDAAHKDACLAIRREHKASWWRQRSSSFNGTVVRSRHQAQGRISPRPTELPAIAEQTALSDTEDEMDVDDRSTTDGANARSLSAPPAVLTELHPSSSASSPVMAHNSQRTHRSPSDVGLADSPTRLASPRSSSHNSDASDDDAIAAAASRVPPRGALLLTKKFHKSTPSLRPSPY